MASCLLGSTLFGALQSSKVSIENKLLGMLSLATLSMITATNAVSEIMTFNLLKNLIFLFGFN